MCVVHLRSRLATLVGDGVWCACVCLLQVGRRAADEEFNPPEAASTTYL